jgi:hypothetical protein
LGTLNKALGDSQLPAEDLAEIFDVWWPRLAASLEAVPAPREGKPQKRPLEDILEEIVTNTREQIRRENIRLEAHRVKDAKIEEVLELMPALLTTLQNRSSLIEGITKTLPSGSRRRDIIGLMKDFGITDISQIQKMLGSARALSDADRSMTDDILKGPGAGEGGEDEKA